MFVLTNTAGASATTPAASKTTLFVDASGVPSTKSSAGTVTPLLTGPAAALAYQPLDTDLTGIAGLTYAADKSIYYTGSAWATYDLTSVGRTLLAAPTQAAQRTALGLGDAAVQNIGTSGSNIPLLNAANSWSGSQSFSVGASLGNDQILNLGNGGAGMRGSAAGIVVFFGGGAGTFFRPGGNAVTTGQLTMSTTETTVSTLLAPSTDNAIDVGLAARRIRTYYGVNSAINTSDARLKTEPRQLKDAEFKAFSAVCRLPPVWRWLSRVHGDENCEAEGQAARKHFGPTVQAAMQVFADNGLVAFENAPFCYDEWEAEPATYDDEGNELTPAREAGDRYSFRKEELLCGMVAALAREIDEKDAKIEVQQAQLNDLAARVAALEAKA